MTYLLPVVAIVIGVLVLSESIAALVLVGIALFLAGVALTRRRTASSRRSCDNSLYGFKSAPSARQAYGQVVNRERRTRAAAWNDRPG